MLLHFSTFWGQFQIPHSFLYITFPIAWATLRPKTKLKVKLNNVKNFLADCKKKDTSCVDIQSSSGFRRHYLFVSVRISLWKLGSSQTKSTSPVEPVLQVSRTGLLR